MRTKVEGFLVKDNSVVKVLDRLELNVPMRKMNCKVVRRR